MKTENPIGLEYYISKVPRPGKENRFDYNVCVKDYDTGVHLYTTDYSNFIIDHQKKFNERKDYYNETRVLVRFLNWLNCWAPDYICKEFQLTGLPCVQFEYVQLYLQDYFSYGIAPGMRGVPAGPLSTYTREVLTTLLINIYNKYNRFNYPTDYHFRWIEGDAICYKLQIYLRDRTQNKKLTRNLPEEVADMMIEFAENYDKGMVLPMLLQRYMGLREGEICNIRQKGPSSLHVGDGYSLKEDLLGRIIYIQIHLEEEYKLRSDGVSVGRIKCERDRTMASFYLDYNAKDQKDRDIAQKINHWFHWHENTIKKAKTEDTKPMFVNTSIDNKTKCHMAMTTADYRYRMGVLLKKVMAVIDAGKNEYLKRWANYVRVNSWGPHWFRHLFTMDLVSRGLKIDEVKYYRGDKNKDSAEAYLSKGEAFERAAKSGVIEALEDMLEEACRTMSEW